MLISNSEKSRVRGQSTAKEFDQNTKILEEKLMIIFRLTHY